MLEKLFRKPILSSRASIGSGSNNNILQNNKIENIIIYDKTHELISLYAKLGEYEKIQQLITKEMSSVRQSHPLYPIFGAKYDYNLKKLISTPETEDAFKKYPKTIKGTINFDIKKFPNMDKSESLLEYAYRTQTPVEFETTTFQEYLGEMEDPYPLITDVNDMTAIIRPPEFPPAVEAFIISGEITIPIMIRRQPCMDYDKIIIGTTSNDCGFDFQLTRYKDNHKSDISLTKIYECELNIQLQREKLLNAIRETKQMKIMIGPSELFNTIFDEDKLMIDMFKNAPILINYIESLLIIEKYTFNLFDPNLGTLNYEDYKTALILASSFEGKWRQFKKDFDDETRCDYDNISDDLETLSDSNSDISVDLIVFSISLQGQEFTADRYQILYRNAKVNNIETVLKNKRKKKKNILVTFRPIIGEEFFYKYCRFDGLKAISQIRL